MGNRAVVTTPDRELGLLVRQNGGRDTIEPLLRYCELKGFDAPSASCSGWAGLCQVLGNFFDDILSVGVLPYTNDEQMNPGDNGIYVIDGWQIVDRIYPYENFAEQNEYDFDEMLHAFDAAMPKQERLGKFLDSAEVPVSDVQLGDVVYLTEYGNGTYETYKVVGFGEGECGGYVVDGVPYVERYDCVGDYSRNINNYIRTETCRIKPRE